MSEILLNDKDKLTLKLLENTKAGTIGIIAELGSGKKFFADKIASKILGAKYTVGSSYIHLDCAAAGVGIDSIRDIQNKLSYRVPGSGEIRRIVLIEHFDYLKFEAQNASLKTLEEPPSDTLIIITINDDSLVLDTVLSRLIQVRLGPVPLKASLKFYKQVAEDKVKKSHTISGGRAGLQHSLIYDEDHALLREIERSKGILTSSIYERLSLVDKMSKEDRNQTILFVEGLIKVVNAVYISELKKPSNMSSAGRFLTIIDQCINTKEDLKNGLSQKLALSKLFVSI